MYRFLVFMGIGERKRNDGRSLAFSQAGLQTVPREVFIEGALLFPATGALPGLPHTVGIYRLLKQLTSLTTHLPHWLGMTWALWKV